jgi:hypothetical protein
VRPFAWSEIVVIAEMTLQRGSRRRWRASVVSAARWPLSHQAAYMREHGVNADPIFQGIQRIQARVVTRRRADLVPDRDWYRSSAFADYRRPCGGDHQLTSVCTGGPGGAMSCFSQGRNR